MIHSGEPIANPAMTLQTFVRLLKKVSISLISGPNASLCLFLFHSPPRLPEVTACLDLGRVAGRENGS